MDGRPKPRSCPFCKNVVARILLPPAGFWEVWVFALLGLKPFRCPDCRRRFLGVGDGVAPQNRRRRGATASAPSAELTGLVREIRESERRLGLETGRAALPEGRGEMERRERALLRAELGAPDDVVDAEILDPLPGEEK